MILFQTFTLKFPRSEDPVRYADGLQANRLEAERWKSVTLELRPRLCPVLYASPTYELVVMQRADPMPAEEFDADIARRLVMGETASIDCEFKAACWGILEGRWVVIDYGNPD